MAIAGLDIGSTGAKITVLSEDGVLLHEGYLDYAAKVHAGAHEVDAGSIFDAVKLLIACAARAVPDISSVGVTSFGESFVLLDARDDPLAPTMMYTDPRGVEEARLLGEVLGIDCIAELCGTEPHPMFSLPKLMWIVRHRPELFARTRRICLMADYVVYMLTGQRVIDHSLAARTMGLDIRTLTWSDELFGAAGVDPTLLSTPVPSGTDAGVIRSEVAAELGVSKSLRVAQCCHDQIAAAVGSGVLRPGLATDGAGTTQCVTPVFSGIPEGGLLQKHSYAVVPFATPGNYCVYAFSFTGGSLIRWFMKGFAGEKSYAELEAGMKDAPTGILALPHFAGAGTPYMDPGAQGAVVGLKLSHGPSDVYRALMEGIVYEMRINIDTLASAGIAIEALNASGGCAKSRLWLQMKADILGLPIRRMSTDEAGTVGGIMLTGVATGAYRDLSQAREALVRVVETFEPRAAMHDAYENHYHRYQKLYRAVRPLTGGNA